MMAKKTSDDFYQGVIACLGVIKDYDNPVLVADILRTMDVDELLRVARKGSDMQWSGLDKFMREYKYML